MAAGRVGGDDDFVLRIFRIDHRPAQQLRIFAGDICVHCLAHLNEAFLLRVQDRSAGRNFTPLQRRITGAGLRCPCVQEQGVFRRSLQHGFSVLLRIGCNGGESVPAVSRHAGADSPALAARVLHQVSLKQHHTPGTVFMSAQHGLRSIGKMACMCTDDI